MRQDPARSSTQVYRVGGMAFRNFVTKSPKMLECLTLAERAAETDFAILITGESGTGKTLLAQAIHNASKRCRNPFVSINMSALSEGVLESELFGHEKGAFTGAARQRIGHFEKANGGTLLLDEIADMSLSAQPKILHAVEYKQFQRVGGETMRYADVRILSCTHCDLQTLAASKRFRHDLLYRLQELVIRVPPLRERLEDLADLCGGLLEECQLSAGLPPMRMSEEALRRMRGYGWPGNIRELKSVIRRAGMLSGGGVIRGAHLGLPAEAVVVAPVGHGGEGLAPRGEAASGQEHADRLRRPEDPEFDHKGLYGPQVPGTARTAQGGGEAAAPTAGAATGGGGYGLAGSGVDVSGLPGRVESGMSAEGVGGAGGVRSGVRSEGGGGGGVGDGGGYDVDEVGDGGPMRLADVEAEHIAWVMELVGGNKTRASRILGIGRSTLERKLARASSVPPAP